MVRCPTCGHECKSSAGLASHQRLAHGLSRGGENRRAAEKFISELRRQGRLEAIDAARVQAVRGIADALDAEPQNAQMWKQFREACESLAVERGNSDDEWERLKAEIDRRATVGDPPKT